MPDVRHNWSLGKWPYYFSIRWYTEDGYTWGWRFLGKGRRAFDLGNIALIFENLRR